MAPAPAPQSGPEALLVALRQHGQAHSMEVLAKAREGLRERKKRLTRKLISDTATGMFLENGFDAVRVCDVAEACGVSEKTVYNYFPTKETLILDQFEDVEEDVRLALGPGAAGMSPVEAVVTVITAGVRRMHHEWSDDQDRFDPSIVRRFSEMVEQTPALLAARREMSERLVAVAAEAMAARAAVNPDDPEPRIAATAIVGLWDVQYRSMRRHADAGMSSRQLCEAVIADVRRAARLIDTGLWSFGAAVQGASGQDQLRLAAEAANDARKQVLTAIRQARKAWQQLREDHEGAHTAGRPGPAPRGRRRSLS